MAPGKVAQACSCIPSEAAVPHKICASIKSHCCSGASRNTGTETQQIRLAKLLLHVWPSLEKQEFCRRARAIRASDPVLGPLALAWLFHGAAQRCPPGPVRRFYLGQMDVATEDAVCMRKIRKGWTKGFGVDDPWEVVYHRSPPPIPRYLSEPTLRSVAEI